MIDLNDTNYAEFLASADKVVIDVWRESCAPCSNYAPVFEEVAKQLAPIPFAKFKLGNEPSAFKRAFMKTEPGKGIKSPLTIVFIKGEPVTKAEGYLTEDQLKAMVVDGVAPQAEADARQQRLFALYAQKGELVTRIEQMQGLLAGVNQEIYAIIGRA